LSDAPSQQILAGPEVKTLFRKRHRLFIHMLSLVLLVAQLGVEAHAYSHLQSDTHGIPATVQYCGGCLSFAPLLSMGGSAPRICIARHAAGTYAPPATIASTVSRLPYAAFRPRGPPQLL